MTNNLYHYTSYDAFVNILATRELWASGIHYLNDGSEFRYAFDRLNGLLDSVMRSESQDAELAEFVRVALRTYNFVDVFVASFSESADLLSQWRAYCPPAQGVSIGFDPESLRIAAEAQHCRLVPCLYDTRKQHDVLTRWLQAASERWHPAQPTTKKAKESLASQFAVSFAAIAPQFKDPAFGEEREWRVISDFNANYDEMVDYRTGRSFIVPYLRFKLPEDRGELDVEQVFIGPTPHPILARFSLKGLMSAKRVTYCKVTNSVVPYRTW